jgi:hypothetical protein
LYVVAAPFGLTVPFNCAVVVVTRDAALVTATGFPSGVTFSRTTSSI